jgi:hypothetical protein
MAWDNPVAVLISSWRPSLGPCLATFAKGIKIGRPRLGADVRQKIAQRAAKGETPYAIARSLGIDRHTAAKYSG